MSSLTKTELLLYRNILYVCMVDEKTSEIKTKTVKTNTESNSQETSTESVTGNKKIHFNGRIEAISGCMFAGKTGELLRRVRRAEIAGYDVTVISPQRDDRYGDYCIGSHDGEKLEATVIPENEEGIEQLYTEAQSTDVIAIDEFNFFTEEFVPVLDDIANDGVKVIVSGLDQTFRGEPFDPLGSLLTIADDVTKLTAVCDICGREATRTQRLIDGDPAPENSPTVQVGGSESYQARCRDCHTVPSDE